MIAGAALLATVALGPASGAEFSDGGWSASLEAHSRLDDTLAAPVAAPAGEVVREAVAVPSSRAIERVPAEPDEAAEIRRSHDPERTPFEQHVLNAEDHRRRSAYEAAIAEYGQALALDPTDPELWRDRGKTWEDWADAQAKLKNDPVRAYAAAIDDYSQAIQRAPGNAEYWRRRGNAREWWADHQVEAGADGSANYAGAIADYSEALRLLPDDGDLYLGRAETLEWWADHDQAQQRDPMQRWAKAFADYGRAIDCDVKSKHAREGRDRVRGQLSVEAARRIEHGHLIHHEVLINLGRRLSECAEAAGAWRDRGEWRLVWAEILIKRGLQPVGEVQLALADLMEAAARDHELSRRIEQGSYRPARRCKELLEPGASWQ